MFGFGTIGSTDEILNGLNFVQSVTDIIFFETLMTLNGPSHIDVRSLYILSRSDGSMKYLVAVRSFDLAAFAFLIRTLFFPVMFFVI